MTPSLWILSFIGSSLVHAGPLTWQIPTTALNAQKGIGSTVVDPTDHSVYQWQKNAFAPAKVMIGTLSSSNGLNGIPIPPIPQPKDNQQKQMPQMPSLPSGGAGNGANKPNGNQNSGGNQEQARTPDRSNSDKGNQQPRAEAPQTPEKSEKPKAADDGLCTASQMQSEQVQSGKCAKLRNILSRSSSCANNQVRSILSKAGQMKDIQQYCPNFAKYGDSSAKQEALRQLLAAIIQKDSQWKDANGLFKISSADFKKYPDCKGLDANSAKDPDANLKCGSCKILTEMAKSGSFSSSSSDPKVAAALKSYCEGRPKSDSSDAPDTTAGR